MSHYTSLQAIITGLEKANLLDKRFIPFQPESLVTYSSEEQIIRLVDKTQEEFKQQDKYQEELALRESQHYKNHAGITARSTVVLETEKYLEEVKKGKPFIPNHEIPITYIGKFAGEEKNFDQPKEVIVSPLDQVKGDYKDTSKYYSASEVLCDLFAFKGLPFASQPVFLTTDTRRLNNDLKVSAFFALKSNNFTGQELASMALKNRNTVVFLGNLSEEDKDFCLKHNLGNIIPVLDINQALNFVARQVRFDYAPLSIAITGSSGKTSLKEIVSHVFRHYYPHRVVSTTGNFNNELGVPITLLDIVNSHIKHRVKPEVAVVEHGANHIGEIARTTTLSCPDIAIINNVQPAHTEGFGGIKGVALAKNEIFANLNVNGVKIINLDSYTNDLMFARNGHQTLLTFSAKNPVADFYLDESTLEFQDEQITFDLYINAFEVKRLHIPHNQHNLTQEIFVDPQQVKVRTNLKGKIGAYNATAAIAVCLAGGVPLDHILYSLQNVPTPARRTKIIKTPAACYIDDSYNANPSSVLASMEILALQKQEHKYFMLGFMAELDYQTKVDFFTEVYQKYIAVEKQPFTLIANFSYVTVKPKVAANKTIYTLPISKDGKPLYVVEEHNITTPVAESSYYRLACKVFQLIKDNSVTNFAIAFKGSNSAKMNLCFKEFVQMLKNDPTHFAPEAYLSQELIDYLK